MAKTILDLLTDVTSFLQTLTGVGTIGKSIFYGTMPGSPNECVAVYPTGGYKDPNAMDGMWRPQFQIAVRAEGFAAGLQKTQTIWTGLDQVWNGLPMIKGRVTADHEPGVYFRDQNQRFLFTMNFTAFTTRL